MMTKTTAFLSCVFMTISSFVGCSSIHQSGNEGFFYKEIPVAKETASTGEGSTIQFQGRPMPLSGQEVKAGETLRAVPLAKKNLSLVNIHETQGKVRIINVVPSLDTKVCEQQTHYLSEKNQGLDQNVQLITISIDTPFAQDRFAKEAGIDNVEFLSDYRGGEFGKSHGLLLEGPHLLARAVMVVDAKNTIRYLQVTPDLGHMPDMDRAFQVARSLTQ